MKKSTIILGILSITTLFLTACGKPNMSFEDAVNNVFHSEIQEMMKDADYYQQNLDFSTKFSIPNDDFKPNITISASSKQNPKDSQWESNISLKFYASANWEKGKIQWDAKVKRLANAIYFKLNSLEMSSSDNSTPDEDAINKIKWQRFFLDLNDERVKEFIKNYYDLRGFSENLNKINNLYSKNKIDKLINEFKESLTNEWALVYSGIYSQFNWYNAYKFWINKEKSLTALLNYFRWITPDDIIDDAMEDIEDKNRDKIFDGFPFSNFEWYLIITWKHKVQIVIENIDIDDYSFDSKLNATFGKDEYKFVRTENGEDVIVISAILTGSRYDINMKVEDLETLSWTITPNISNWKINVDFDLVMKYEDYGDKIKIPLKWNWTWKKIPEFNVKAPNNYKNLLEELPNNSSNNETKYSNVTEYNDKLVDLVKECTNSTQTLQEKYEKSDGSETVESIKQILEEDILICQKSETKVKELWDYDGDSSLKDAAVELLSIEVKYLQEFSKSSHYRNIDNITDEDRVTYDWIVDNLNQLLVKSIDQFINLQETQKTFAAKHGLILDDKFEE